MMEIRIKDNSITNKQEFNDIELLTSKIADKTLEQLEKDGVFVFPECLKDIEDITKDQMILQSINDCYCSSNVMGFLGYGKERLVISSRFSVGDNDYFLQYLLHRVLEIPNLLDLSTSANHDQQIFNLFLFLFPKYLKEAMRKGVFKTYLQNKYNDSHVKGSIDITRHIRQNTPFIGNISYNQREFAYDNYLMELVRHTIEFIKTNPYGNNLLRRVKDEVKSVVAATNDYEFYDRRNIILENRKRPIRHAYFREYRALQHLCLMILQYEKHQIGSGIREIYGILFDGAWLWEEYINSLISNLFYHPMNKGGNGAQRLFAGNVGLIYPDFISRNNINRVIADAKYKPIDNIGNKDYLQVLAYMFRFDATRGLYFYPEKGEQTSQKLFMNSGSTYENNVIERENISVIKCGLRIPCNANNYEEFLTAIEKSENDFMEYVFKTLTMNAIST